ncbi:MAG TPA: zinc-dependent alcohol dehydrogenase family protein [Mycobacteriales bacterium]|nr:zinc-dependent alcohol dehydrogenase family protein [Mycobacteriales bacterium]
MTAAATIEIVEVADPTPAPHEVVVQVAATGICGTDLHVLHGEHGARPVIPGHELSGTVVAVGSGVDTVHLGDRVAVDPNLPCGACTSCRRGRTNLCQQLRALGITEPGAAAELMAAPASNCVRLPSHVDLQSAALIEPLSCAVHAFDVLQTRLASTILIYGAGTMGLLMLELAKHHGAAAVDVVETMPDRRSRAATFGCSSVAAAANEIDRAGWDVVIDATGDAAAIQTGLGQVSPGGTFLQFGVASPDARVTISPYDIYRREITITGSMAVLHSFERAAALLGAGAIDPTKFITGRFALERYDEALDDFRGGRGIKTLVMP